MVFRLDGCFFRFPHLWTTLGCIFTLIRNNHFWGFLSIITVTHLIIGNIENGSLSSKFPIFSSEFTNRPIFGAHREMSNHLIYKPWLTMDSHEGVRYSWGSRTINSVEKNRIRIRTSRKKPGSPGFGSGSRKFQPGLQL